MSASTTAVLDFDKLLADHARATNSYAHVSLTPVPSPADRDRTSKVLPIAKHAVWAIVDAMTHGDHERLGEVARQALYDRLFDDDTAIAPAAAFALICLAANDGWPTSIADAGPWVRAALDHVEGAAVEVALVGGLGDIHEAGHAALVRLADLLDNLESGQTDPIDAGPVLARYGAAAWGVRLARAVTERTENHLALTRMIAVIGRELAAPHAAAALADDALTAFPDIAILLTTASRQYRLAGRHTEAVDTACRAISGAPSKPWYAANTLRSAARAAAMHELARRADNYSDWENPQWPDGLVSVPTEALDPDGKADRGLFIQWVLAAKP